MKQISSAFVFALFLTAQLGFAQLVPPADQNNNAGPIPDIPVPDVPNLDTMLPDEVALPKSTPVKTQSTPVNNTPAPSTNNNQDTVLPSGPPQQLSGAQPVNDPAEQFVSQFHFEVISSSADWSGGWNHPSFGTMRVTSVPVGLTVPHGLIIKWQRDSLGNPMAILRAKLPFPRIVKPDAGSQEAPLRSDIVSISQVVTFYLQRGQWFAAASPIYITMESPDNVHMLLPVNRGVGVWRQMVGTGGVYIENFLQAGVSAARVELSQYFRDEEIRLFLAANHDVIFYLRPGLGVASF